MSTSPSKTLVLTGANGGMGYACGQHFLALGWHVLAIDHFSQGVKQAPSAAYRPLACDVRDPDLCHHVEQALASMPPVQALVNLVGCSVGNRIESLTDEDWDQAFAINVTPAMQLIRLLAPQLKAQGGGSIVNVGSPVGIIGARKASYAASKAALQGLTMACARNLGPDNIRVNLVLPGPTITGMTEDWDAAKRQAIAQSCFLQRLCTPEDIAKAIGFLVGPDSACMTGSILDLTGGSLYGH